MDTGISDKRLLKAQGAFRKYKSNYFFNAFLHAYMQHGNVLLVPDEIWIMICCFVSKYID
jgi:hypothetical protein